MKYDKLVCMRAQMVLDGSVSQVVVVTCIDILKIKGQRFVRIVFRYNTHLSKRIGPTTTEARYKRVWLNNHRNSFGFFWRLKTS